MHMLERARRYLMLPLLAAMLLTACADDDEREDRTHAPSSSPAVRATATGEAATATTTTTTTTTTQPSVLNATTDLLTPVASPRPEGRTPGPDDPIRIEIESHHDDQKTPEQMLLGELIVTGTVRAFLPAYWTTSNGNEPPDMPFPSGDFISIQTPIIVDLDQSPLWDKQNAVTGQQSIIVLIDGGTVGRVTIYNEYSGFDYRVGERVVMSAHAIDSPWVGNYPVERVRDMLPEGYDTAWLPAYRWIMNGMTVVQDDVRIGHDEFFSRLDAAIDARQP